MNETSESPAAQRVYAEAQAERDRLDAQALRWVLSDESGLRVLQRLIWVACGVETPNVAQGRPIEHAQLWEGRRHVGLDVLGWIEIADPEARARLDAFAAKERAADRMVKLAAEAARKVEHENG